MILKIRSPPHIFSSSRATMEIIQPTTAQYRRGEDNNKSLNTAPAGGKGITILNGDDDDGTCTKQL